MKMSEAGNNEAGRLAQDASTNSLTTSSKIVEAWCEKKVIMEIIMCTPEELLGVMINTKQSVAGYKLRRMGAKERNVNIYPPYNLVLAAKDNCCPSKNEVTNTVFS